MQLVFLRCFYHIETCLSLLAHFGCVKGTVQYFFTFYTLCSGLLWSYLVVSGGEH